MITDHSSAGFEFLLRDRPLVRIHRPALLERANIHPDYVGCSPRHLSPFTVAETLEAVQRGLEDRGRVSGASRGRGGALLSARDGHGARGRPPLRSHRPRRSRRSSRNPGGLMPLVSVIVPAYNTGRYIREALASVLAQTISDLEILVVDDGSDDQTAATVETTAARDGRVRLFKKANGGVSSARNLALEMARGEFLALLDSDDMWDPRFLEEQLAVLRARPDIDLVTGNAVNLGGHRDGLPVRPCPDPRREPIWRPSSPTKHPSSS